MFSFVFVLLSLIEIISCGFTLQSAPNPSYTFGSNLIANGDFSNPPLSGSWYQNPTPFGAFRASKYLQVIVLCRVRGGLCGVVVTGLNCTATPNKQGIDTDSIGWNEIVETSPTLSAGLLYRFQYTWGQPSYSSGMPVNNIIVLINGTQITNVTNYGACGFTLTTFYVRVDSAGPCTFTWQPFGVIDGNGIHLTDISVQLVNEPATPPNPPNSTNSTNSTITPSNESPILPNFESNVSRNYYLPAEYSQAIQSKANDLSQIKQDFFPVAHFFFISMLLTRLIPCYLTHFIHLQMYSADTRIYSPTARAYLTLTDQFYQSAYTFTDFSIIRKFGQNATTILLKDSNKYNNSINYQYNDAVSSLSLEIWRFILTDVPLIVGVFLFCQFMFYFLKKYKIKKLFQKYYFNLFLLFLLFDGKIQRFVGYFVVDLFSFTEKSFSIKFGNVLNLVFCFIYLSISFAIYFIIKSKITSKYSKNKQKTNIFLILFLISTNPIYNLMLGFTHGAFIYCNQLQLMVLVFIEISYIIFAIFSLRKLQRNSIKIYIELSLSFLRIALIFSLYLWDRYVLNKEQKQHLWIQNLQQAIFIIYGIIYFCAIGIFVVKFILAVLQCFGIRIIKKKIKLKFKEKYSIKPLKKKNDIIRMSKSEKKGLQVNNQIKKNVRHLQKQK